MRDSQHWISLRSYALAFAVVLSPVFLQTISCRTGNANLVSVELLVDGVDQIDFTPGQTLYTATFANEFATLRAQSEDPTATIRYQWWTGSTLIDTWTLGVGSGEVTLDVPEGQNMLRVHVTAPGGAYSYIDIEVDRSPAGSYPCTEQGIRDAIADGGGARIECLVPTVVTTAAEIVIDNDVILDGLGELIVDGNYDHRVFSVAPGVNAELHGVNVNHGLTTENGGGILNEGALVLVNSTVTGNHAPGTHFVDVGHGGGIFNDGTLVLNDSVVSANSNRGYPSLGNGGNGGGIYNAVGATVTLNNSTVSGNEAGIYSFGGGIYSEGTLTLNDSQVIDNVALGEGNLGGGIYHASTGPLTMIRSSVSGNISWEGGGLAVDWPSTAMVTASTISGNEATLYGGGGIFLGGTLTLSNSTVSGNQAAGDGGGIWNGFGGSLTLVHSTVAANSAPGEGSAIYNNASTTATVQNTVIDGSCGGMGIVGSGGYNIESPAETCNFSEPTDRVSTPYWALLLGSLQDNGGTTLTMMPRAGSVAIDVIPPQDCVDMDGNLLTVDQRGVARPQGTSCDVGAVEFNEAIGSTWPAATPEEHGFDSDQLAGLVEWIDQNDRPIDSLLLVRNGVLILDAYFYPYFGDPPHDVASVTKSVTSTVAGIAIEQGYLNGVDQKVMPLFPEEPAVGGKEDIEVGHLLTMSSGLACGESDIFPMMASGDWVQYILDRSMANAPGTTFRYCSPCAHWLSAMITRASGQTADEIAQQHLFGPLGIVSANWPTDPQGISRGGGDLRLHPHDMARIGHLFLNDGTWNGQPVLSAGWVEEATGPSLVTSSYGYLWWRFSGGFEAVGRGGQSIRVHPDERLVVALTGRGSGGSSEVMSSVLAALQSNEPLPPNPVGQDRLMTAIANATLPPPAQPVPPLPAIASDISGQNYQLDPNQYGVECYSVQFNSPSDVLLSVTLPDGAYTLPIGMDGIPLFSEGEPGGFPVGLVGSWTTPTKFVAHYDQLGGSTYLRVESEFGSDIESVQVQLVDKTGYFPTQIVQGTRVDTCD